jgi:hypothetical protein
MLHHVMWSQGATECGIFIKAVIDLGDYFQIFPQPLVVSHASEHYSVMGSFSVQWNRIHIS